MPNINYITDLFIDALTPYRTTSEVQLMRYYEPEAGLFIMMRAI